MNACKKTALKYRIQANRVQAIVRRPKPARRQLLEGVIAFCRRATSRQLRIEGGKLGVSSR